MNDGPALARARRANLTRLERALIAAAVAAAERPDGPDDRARRAVAALAADRIRLDLLWAASEPGRRAAALARLAGTTEHAEALALRLHDGHVDKMGVPYEHHLRAVAAGVRADGGTDDEISAAWLHDSVEDLPGVDAPFLLGQGVSDGAVRVVLACTHDEDPDGDAIAKVTAGGPSARKVKRADLAHNTRPDRSAALLRIKVAAARRRAADAGRDPDIAAADVVRGFDRRLRAYAAKKARLAGAVPSDGDATPTA